ncbi:hypothetical protein LSUE1_G005977 [Lachnellula suecica]|uniref:Uncharacterized protein n=1 Tax=Lachnellula suecica TaxID=602035 RepID=A0A8T9C259_9HELO|nr:hypothetical protein LSUE1_G005977 [Lachnellula suecica]
MSRFSRVYARDIALGGSDNTRLSFCFLYKYQSLRTVTQSQSHFDMHCFFRPKEANRLCLRNFGIAIALARPILAFHMCSSNVMVFKYRNSSRFLQIELSVSVEFARLDTAKHQTLNTLGGVDFDIICLPDLVRTIESANSGRPKYQLGSYDQIFESKAQKPQYPEANFEDLQ